MVHSSDHASAPGGSRLAQLWFSFSSVLVQFWFNFGSVLVQLWLGFGPVLAVLVQFWLTPPRAPPTCLPGRQSPVTPPTPIFIHLPAQQECTIPGQMQTQACMDMHLSYSHLHKHPHKLLHKHLHQHSTKTAPKLNQNLTKPEPKVSQN